MAEIKSTYKVKFAYLGELGCGLPLQTKPGNVGKGEQQTYLQVVFITKSLQAHQVLVMQPT
jgi:hypothetical protein